MTQGRPTAAPAHFPYKHDSMAVVMVREGSLWKSCGHCRSPQETRCRTCQSAYNRASCERDGKAYDRARYERERRSVGG